MNGSVVWITGLSGAGKTTLAKTLLPQLPQPHLLLDGDEMREALSLLLDGYAFDARLRLAMTYSRLCRLVASQGTNVVCATISMFHDVRKWNRENIPNYCEVFLNVPEDERKCRDYKNVYVAGNEHCIVGDGIEAELPCNPDMEINPFEPLEETVAKIVSHIKQMI